MLSKREKIAYGLGDTASNIVFQTVMMFLTYFYTEYFWLGAGLYRLYVPRGADSLMR